MSGKIAWLRLFSLLLIPLLFVLCPGDKARASQDAKVMNSGGNHCIDVRALSDMTGSTVEFQNNGAQAGLTNGSRWIVFVSGLALAVTDSGMRALPTCPFRRDGVFYVPTRITVEMLGGSMDVGSDSLDINCNGKHGTVPTVEATEDPPAGPEQVSSGHQ